MLMRRPGLLVNKEGQRFFNEEQVQNTTYAGNAIARQTGNIGFMILTETQIQKYLDHYGLPFYYWQLYALYITFCLTLKIRGTSLAQVQTGDIVIFMVLVCQEHYTPTSLGAHLTGLRRFVCIFPELNSYASKIPERIPKKYDITPSYTNEEHKKIVKFLVEGELSLRNRAIALIAFETGLRAVDICKLKFSDIDWKHDIICLEQKKTGKVLIVLAEADVDPDGRISGTRMTRHSYVSRMLRNGIPLPVISEALGHCNPDSTMRYLLYLMNGTLIDTTESVC